MKRSKFIVIFLLILSFVLPFTLTGCSFEDYARITDVYYRAIVVDEPGSEGKIVVTERLTFDVHAASRSNGFWELWRDLCESETDGVKVHYKVNSVKQIMPDGSAVEWPESPQLYWDDYDYINPTLGPGKWFHSPGPYNESRRQYECLLFYVNDLYREQVTFEIEYEMYNAVLKYNDCADLYISMYSGETIQYLNSFRGEILIPTNKMPSPNNYSFTTYGTSKSVFPVEESATMYPGYHTFYFDLRGDELNFTSDREYLEFDLVSYGPDKHAFAQHTPNNDYTQDDVLSIIWETQAEYTAEYERQQMTRLVVFFICIAIAAGVAFYGLQTVSNMKKKCNCSYTGSYKDTYRNIPSDLDPKFAAALVFAKDKKKQDDSGVFSALLLSLARKKYLDLKELSSNDVLITLLEDPQPVVPQPAEPAYETHNPVGSPVGSLNSTPLYTPAYSSPNTLTSKNPFGSMFERAEPIRPQVPVQTRESLTMCEEYYLNLIKRHTIDNCITMEILQRRISSDYDYTRTFNNNIQRAIVDIGLGQGYLQKANWEEPKKKMQVWSECICVLGVLSLLVNLIIRLTTLRYAYGGFFILAATCILMSIYTNANAHKFVLLTPLGEEEYKKWRGLYNFLKSDTLINDKTFIELPLWEKYLVYATAFDISEKVIAAIKIHCQTAATEAPKSIIYNSYCRSSARIRNSGRTFHSSVKHGSFRSHSSSYGGGSSYGGFSRSYGGGGRGGGGGGGGH